MASMPAWPNEFPRQKQHVFPVLIDLIELLPIFWCSMPTMLRVIMLTYMNNWIS